MRTPWLTWVWPILILLSTLAVALITFLFPAVGMRPFVIMGFLFLIPGMTVVRFFRTNETAVEWMLAIVLSFTIDAFVAGIVLYAGQWSPINIMSFLIGFCFIGAIAQLVILRPAPPRIETEPSNSKATKVKIDTEGAKDIEMRFEHEGTQEQSAASLQSHTSSQEEAHKKTDQVEKPELSGKEA